MGVRNYDRIYYLLIHRSEYPFRYSTYLSRETIFGANIGGGWDSRVEWDTGALF